MLFSLHENPERGCWRRKWVWQQRKWATCNWVESQQKWVELGAGVTWRALRGDSSLAACHVSPYLQHEQFNTCIVLYMYSVCIPALLIAGLVLSLRGISTFRLLEEGCKVDMERGREGGWESGREAGTEGG